MLSRVLRCLSVACLLGAAIAPSGASAQNPPNQGLNNNNNNNNNNQNNGARDVPEFDPTVVGAIAALVAGGGLIIARRRSNKT